MHSLKVNSKGSHDRRWLRPPGSSSQTRQAAGLCKPPSSRPTPPGLVLWPLHTPSLVSCDFILVLSVERGHGVGQAPPLPASLFSHLCMGTRGPSSLLAWTSRGRVSPFGGQVCLPPTQHLASGSRSALAVLPISLLSTHLAAFSSRVCRGQRQVPSSPLVRPGSLPAPWLPVAVDLST